MSDESTGRWLRRILFGTDAHGGRNVAVAVLGASLGFALLFNAAFTYQSVFAPLMDLLWWESGALLLVGIAAATAYRFDSLAHCWAVGFAPPFGVLVNFAIIGFGMGGDSGLMEILGMGLLGGVTGAIVLGTPGYLIGSFASRLGKG